MNIAYLGVRKKYAKYEYVPTILAKADNLLLITLLMRGNVI